jgi:predicted DNA-binding WGR domain protein
MMATRRLEPAELAGDVELRLIDPDTNKRRVWGCTGTRTLWGEPALFIAWGRLGRPMRRRLEVFGSTRELEARRRRLLGVRRRHGYL